MLVSVIVPVYRNAATLEELHARLAAALESIAGHREIVFVDDACPDGSLDVLRRIAARDPGTGVISLEQNAGQNRAILVGLAHALGDVVVVLDADLQDAPEALPALIAELRGDVTAVFAGRDGIYESRLRTAGSKVFKRLLYLLTRGRLPRDAGLFLVMTRPMIDRIRAAGTGDAYVLGLMARTRLPMRSTPVHRVERGDGPSSYDSLRLLRTAWLGLRTIARGPRRTAPPLRIREMFGGPFAGRGGSFPIEVRH